MKKNAAVTLPGCFSTQPLPSMAPLSVYNERFPVGAKLHVGCGPKRIQGWLNTDGVVGIGPDGVVELHNPQLPASTFRAIYGCHVLEHCWPQDTPRILRMLREALLPGGTLVLSVPDVRLVVANCIDRQVFGGEESAMSVLYGGTFSRETKAPDLHRQTFWKERLERLLHAAGFVNVRAWGRGTYPEIDAVKDWATYPHDAQGKSTISLNLEADRPGVMTYVERRIDTARRLDVSIVLGTVNRESMLKECVEAIRSSVGSLSYEIVVAYGTEEEVSLPWMRAQKDIVPVLGGMEGAIPAFNKAYRASRGYYLCVINDDVLVDGDSIQKAAQHLDDDAAASVVAFKHDRSDGKGYTYEKFKNGVPHPNEMVARRSACEAVIERIGELWGDEKHRTDKTYGGDSAFGVMCSVLGLRIDVVEGVTCRDRLAKDALRQRNQITTPGHSHAWGAMYLPLLDRPIVQSVDAWPKLYVPLQGRPPRRSPLEAGRALRVLSCPIVVAHWPQAAFRKAIARVGPAVEIPWNGAQMNTHAVVEAARTHKPDLIWMQIQSDQVPPNFAAALRDAAGPGCTVVQWTGDVRTSGSQPVERWLVQLGAHLDLMLADNCTYPRKLAIDEKVKAACGYLSHGCEEGLSWSSEEKEEGGVVFLGTNYRRLDGGAREQLFATLQRELPGVVRVYGQGWDNSSVNALPFVPIEQGGGKIMRKAAVTISISLYHDLARYTSNRLKYGLAVGAVLAVRKFADMEGLGLVDGYNCLVWESQTDLVRLLRDWTRPERAADRYEIRKRAVALSARFSWDYAIEELLAIVRDYRERKRDA